MDLSLVTREKILHSQSLLVVCNPCYKPSFIGLYLSFCISFLLVNLFTPYGFYPFKQIYKFPELVGGNRFQLLVHVFFFICHFQGLPLLFYKSMDNFCLYQIQEHVSCSQKIGCLTILPYDVSRGFPFPESWLPQYVVQRMVINQMNQESSHS